MIPGDVSLVAVIVVCALFQHAFCQVSVFKRPALKIHKPLLQRGSLDPLSSPLNINRLSSIITYTQTKSGIRLAHLSAPRLAKEFEILSNSLTKSIDIRFKTPVNESNNHKHTRTPSTSAVIASGTADLVLGLFKVGSVTYLGLATQTSPCPELPLTRRIDKVRFLPIESVQFPSVQEQKELDLLYTSFYRHDFYFSQKPLVYDVTRTTQGNEQLHLFYDHRNNSIPRTRSARRAVYSSTFRDSDSRFFWNKLTINPLITAIEQLNATENIQNDILNTWITPITSAAISSFPFRLNNQSYSLSLISRRSRCRQGPRLLVRGIDTQGDVANFVETEQILRKRNGNEVASFVQVRGSIPLFWEQTDRFMPKPRISLQHDYAHATDHADASSTHLRGLYQRYVRRYMSGVVSASLHTSDGMFKAHRDSHHARVANAVPSIVLLNLIDKVSSQGDIGRFMIRVLDKIATRTGKKPSDSVFSDRHEVTVCNYSFTVSKSSRGSTTPRRGTQRSKLSTFPSPSATSLRHVWYDFHHHRQGPALPSAATSSHTQGTTRDVLSYIADVLSSNSSFFLSSRNVPVIRNQSIKTESSEQPTLQQTRIIRTNCVDSLDRTNVVQSEIARNIIFRQLQLLDPSLVLQNSGDSVSSESDHSDAFLAQRQTLPVQVEKQFRKMWEKNGDKISMLYAGTRALKQDYVRKGRRTLKGLGKDTVNSAKRYYLNIFEDAARHRGVNLVTGSAEDVSVRSELDEKESCAVGMEQGGDVAATEEKQFPSFWTRTLADDLTSSPRHTFDPSVILNSTKDGDIIASRFAKGENLAGVGGGQSGEALRFSNNTVQELQTLLSARNSKVIAALDNVLRKNIALIASNHKGKSTFAPAINIRLRGGASQTP
mmetsp:Transcript_1848/g.3294  ORF Transcript_1848/g.3294 Transcript_1848/m.3294 type:complete len:886 (-) Transcript_1848:108-2765(-)